MNRFYILLFLSAAFVFAGCAAGESVPFAVNESVVRARVGREYQQGSTIVRFKLDRRLSVEKPGYALALRGDAFPATFDLRLLDRGEEVLHVPVVLAERDKQGVIHIPVHTVPFNEVRISANQVPGEFRISGLAVEETVRGVRFDPEVVADAIVGYSVRTGNPHNTYIVKLRRLLSTIDPLVEPVIAVSYRSAGEAANQSPQSFSIRASTDEDLAELAVVRRPEPSTVYLHRGSIGFAPERLEIAVETGTIDIVSVTVETVPRDLSPAGVPEPVPADLGAVLAYERSWWRREDYEVFRWNHEDNILIFDTASYGVQSRMFKRLAFYVEKSDSPGRLFTNEELAGAHGWNAHDYRAADLARFFTDVESTGFSLNQEEYHLLDILLESGVLLRGGDGIGPGRGGILSVSQESNDRLRELFLVHEGAHGFFFENTAYERAVFDIWNSLAPDEQRFWRVFLAWKGYNVEDEYLVVNEFQAYLLQQPVVGATWYFANYNVPQMISDMPAYESFLLGFLARFPKSFVRAASSVEEAAYRIGGLRASDLMDLHWKSS